MNGYAALAQHSRTRIGDGIISDLFSAAGRGVENVVESERQKKAQEKTAAEIAQQTQAVIAADRTAKDALAKAMVSEDAKTPSASADRLAADMALQAEDAAAAGLSPEGQKRRSEAARAALERATSEWQAASGNPTVSRIKEMWVRAAQQVYAKTQNQMLVQAATLPGGIAQMRATPPAPTSWLAHPVIGPIPGWGVVAGVLGIVGAVLATVRRG